MIEIKEPFMPGNFYKGICESSKNMLFFDIETTGLSREYCTIYLIGAAARHNGVWELRQWFAESPQEEGLVIEEFLDYARGYDTLIHFNGQRFDLPFTQARAERNEIPWTLEFEESIDLMYLFKPFKEMAGLPNIKQKSIEDFLGITSREDVMSGGELIPVYYDYVEKRRPKDLKLLLLHNADDVRCMVDLTQAAIWRDFFHSELRFLKGQSTEEGLVMHFESPMKLPVLCNQDKDGFSLSAGGNSLSLSVKAYDGELKYFYPDYQNYYYVPAEDMVVHKSIASFMEKGARKKATKQNCYVKRCGHFYPQPGSLVQPEFKMTYKDKVSYFLLEEELTNDFALAYLRMVLSGIFKI